MSGSAFGLFFFWCLFDCFEVVYIVCSVLGLVDGMDGGREGRREYWVCDATAIIIHIYAGHSKKQRSLTNPKPPHNPHPTT